MPPLIPPTIGIAVVAVDGSRRHHYRVFSVIKSKMHYNHSILLLGCNRKLLRRKLAISLRRSKHRTYCDWRRKRKSLSSNTTANLMNIRSKFLPALRCRLNLFSFSVVIFFSSLFFFYFPPFALFLWLFVTPPLSSDVLISWHFVGMAKRKRRRDVERVQERMYWKNY